MSDDQLISVQVNPLTFLKVDEPWSKFDNSGVSADDVLAYLCTPEVAADVDAIISRYKMVSVENPRIFAAPVDDRILSKLIWPLKHAKSSYSLGNYIGAIALCGMVSEMVAIMLFDLHSFKVNGHEMDIKTQKSVFGSEFEKLGQERRVSILFSYGLISSEIKTLYDKVREIRRKYLHFWSQSNEGIETDAVDCFVSTVKIVVDGLGLSVVDGRLILRPEIISRLKEKSFNNGLVQDAANDAVPHTP